MCFVVDGREEAKRHQGRERYLSVSLKYKGHERRNTTLEHSAL